MTPRQSQGLPLAQGKSPSPFTGLQDPHPPDDLASPPITLPACSPSYPGPSGPRLCLSWECSLPRYLHGSRLHFLQVAPSRVALSRGISPSPRPRSSTPMSPTDAQHSSCVPYVSVSRRRAPCQQDCICLSTTASSTYSRTCQDTCPVNSR